MRVATDGLGLIRQGQGRYQYIRVDITAELY